MAGGQTVPTRRPTTGRVRERSVLGIIGRALVGVSVAAAIGWGALLVAGWRFFVVTTPSMSPQVPVGALVVAEPAERLHLGEVAVFRPPGYSQTFVHTVVQVGPGGTYRTKGLLDAVPDPWTITDANVLGRVAGVVPVAGFAVQAFPFWVALGALAWGTDRLLRRRHRAAVLGLATALGLEVPVVLGHALVGMQLVNMVATGKTARAFVVATGFLPERLQLGTGRAVTVATGHAATLSGAFTSHLAVVARSALPWWGWIAVLVVCGMPLWVALLAGSPSLDAHRPGRRLAVVSAQPGCETCMYEGYDSGCYAPPAAASPAPLPAASAPAAASPASPAAAEPESERAITVTRGGSTTGSSPGSTPVRDER